MGHSTNTNMSMAGAKYLYLGSVVPDNIYVFSLYRNPDVDDQIYECLLTSMAAVQAEDVRASFLVMGNLNGHHQGWLGTTTMNRHGCGPRLCNGIWL